jgi:type IV secretory pathway VirJ component
MEEAALMITKAGVMVAEVDTPAYLAGLDKLDGKCHRLVGDADGLSRQLQRKYNFSNYLTPLVVGVGEGGTVAELVLAQAPAETIAGAVSLDPSATVATQRPICGPRANESGTQGFRYLQLEKLPGKWTVGLSPHAKDVDRQYVENLRTAGAQVRVVAIGGNVSRGEALRSLVLPYVPRRREGVTDIASLPLIELPVERSSEVMAVVMSGDGGWRDLDKTVAESLQRQGVPVVGWDSLRYFWSKKTPERTAADLAAVLETFTQKWQADKVALIGYSFGADVLPFAYNLLPETQRSQVALIALLGFAKSADFEINVGEFLGESFDPGAAATTPQIAKISPGLIQCFYGQSEEDTACPGLQRTGAEVVRTEGGHHFDGNYEALATRILLGLKQRIAAKQTTRVSEAR